MTKITTAKLLTAAKRAQGIPSNARLARALDVPEKTVQRWNTGHHTPDDAYAVKLAELAGVNPGFALASLRAEREAGTPLASLWEGVARQLEKALPALAAVILSMFFTGGPDGGAQAATASAGEASLTSQHSKNIHWRGFAQMAANAKRALSQALAWCGIPGFAVGALSPA